MFRAKYISFVGIEYQVNVNGCTAKYNISVTKKVGEQINDASKIWCPKLISRKYNCRFIGNKSENK